MKSNTVAKQNKVGSQPGLPGSGSTRRVNRVSPGQIPSCFLLKPGPALGPGRPGPGLTRRAGPGFKTMLLIYVVLLNNIKH